MKPNQTWLTLPITDILSLLFNLPIFNTHKLYQSAYTVLSFFLFQAILNIFSKFSSVEEEKMTYSM